ncbi:hypothetical protein [Ornithinibacillus bavariensis]|uniref:Uncharacterized protein n=1 Tax=Ornithinibacillus bavariensis TaxID=545502 RepID=A0A919X6R2_9BACI|nr:hypothetical protein [Ornithinibacillus bavariensis]GIO26961.1 hypothetical protein J43TS3_15720 [Ornithinibacillus bavariensis]
MKIKLPIILVGIVLLLTACSSDDSEKKADIEKEEKTISKTVNKEEESTKEQEPTLDESWFGDWVFLSDDINGSIQIQKETDNQVSVYIEGSSISTVNNSSYGNAIEGSGTIEDNKIAFKRNIDGTCTGTLEKNDNMITLTTDSEACNTPQIYLDGEYIKADSIEQEPLITEENGEFFVYGVTLGDSPSFVKHMLGNPTFEGPSEDGFYPWVLEYDKPTATISIFEGLMNSIIVGNISLDEFTNGIPGEFTGKFYKTEDDTTLYLYNPENEHLLIYRAESEDLSTGSILFQHADGNFHVGVENGWIIETDSSWE